ncbi:MAG: glycyl-radical enzyme activating protein [Clostridia bacterium]|nr:glycyl-radical enzyme activating protein [Clostridia bacterium]
MTGKILNTKRFEIHDGPGMRTTLFLKGCPLRCKWCHNPESFKSASELAYYAHKCIGCGACASVCPMEAHTFSDGVHTFDVAKCTACGKCVDACPKEALMLFGKEVTPAEILPVLLEDKIFFDESNGGVTISGGEPLMQPQFCKELLSFLKENGISTALDTSLYAKREALDKVLELVDIFLIDIKAIDPAIHKSCTGVSNEIILDNLRYIDSLGKKYEIRIPFVPSENGGEIEKIADFITTLKNADRVKLLAYHDLSRTKYSALALDYTMGDAKPPSRDEYEAAYETLKSRGINAIHK